MVKDKRGIAFLYFVAIVLSVIVLASILAASVYRVYIIEDTGQTSKGLLNWKLTSIEYNVLVNSALYCVSKITTGQLEEDTLSRYSIVLKSYYGSVEGGQMGVFNCYDINTRTESTDISNTNILNTLTLKYSTISFKMDLDGKTYNVTYKAEATASTYNANQGSMGATDIRQDISFQSRITISWKDSGVTRKYVVDTPTKIVYGYAVFGNGATKLNIQVKPINYEYLWEISTPLVLSGNLKSIEIHIISSSGIHNDIIIKNEQEEKGGS